MLQWRVNIMDELKNIGLNSNQMRQKRLFGQSTIQKMRHQKLVSWAEFDRLCGVLGKQPGELLEWVPGEAIEESDADKKTKPSVNVADWYKPNVKGGE